MLRTQVRVSHRHGDGLMTHQLLYGANVDASHHDPTRKRMPQIIPVEIDHASFRDRVREDLGSSPT
jgi:hypothetical protein